MKKSLLLLFVFTLSVTLISFMGCEKKAEEPAQQPAQTEQPAVTPAPAADTTAPVVAKDTVATKPEVTIPNLVGTWTGTMFGRTATLKIGTQDGLTFSGSLKVNLIEPVDQQVSGKFNVEKGTFSMRDQKRHIQMGTYNGKFTKGFKSMSGTFTVSDDKSTTTFSFSK